MKRHTLATLENEEIEAVLKVLKYAVSMAYQNKNRENLALSTGETKCERKRDLADANYLAARDAVKIMQELRVWSV